MSLNLSATTHTLEIATTGAGVVNVEISFTDVLAGVSTGGSQTTSISSATTTTVCAAPAASTVRFIDEISVVAVGANGVLVKKDISGTETTLIGSVALGAGERIQFVSARGFRTFNADGSEKAGGAPGLATTTQVLTGTDTATATSPDSIAALWEKGADNAGGATIALTEGGFFDLITSTTAITAFTLTPDKAGRTVQVRFQTARTLTHNATSLILPGAANITTAAGDTAMVTSLGSGNFIVTDYMKVSGAPPVLITNAMIATHTITGTTQAQMAQRTVKSNLTLATANEADNTTQLCRENIAGGCLTLTTAQTATAATTNLTAGAYTILGNSLEAGSEYAWEAVYYAGRGATVTGTSVIIEMLVNGAVVRTLTIAIDATASANHIGTVKGVITARTIGAGGTMMYSLTDTSNIAGTTGVFQMTRDPAPSATSPATTALDTTANRTTELRMRLSLNTATVYVHMLSCTLVKIR